MINGTPYGSYISLIEETDSWTNPKLRPNWKPSAAMRRVRDIEGTGRGLDLYNMEHAKTRIVAVTPRGVSKTFLTKPTVDVFPTRCKTVSFYEKLSVIHNREILKIWPSKDPKEKTFFTTMVPNIEGLPLSVGPTFDMFWQSLEHAMKISAILPVRSIVVLKHVETLTNY